MPKSRGRRPRKQSRSRQVRQRRQRYDEVEALRRSRISETPRLTFEQRTAMRAAADAELRGDPAESLRQYEAFPHFDDSWHHGRLTQLVELGDEAPGWLWSRWLTVQTRRPVWTGARGGELPDPAMKTTIETCYPHGVPNDRLQDVSLDFFVASLRERDWVLRQLVVYEHGGLRELVEKLAAPQLVDRADHVREWVDAPMGGYRLDSDDDGVLQLTDLGTGEEVEVLDLGLAADHEPGTHFLGRLVPITDPPHQMFEWRPLAVDEDTAQEVAEDPEEWLSIIATRAHAGLLPDLFSYQEDDCMMTSDLPSRFWLGLLDPDDIGKVPTEEGLIAFDDVALLVLAKLLRLARYKAQDLSVARHVLEALLLEPGLLERIRERFGGRGYSAAWLVLAGAVRGPAQIRCLGLAESGSAVLVGSASD